MTIKFENTNVRFGTEGPFEAESKEALADDMMPTIRDWAGDPSATMTADDMRAEFIDGLVAVWAGEPRVIFDNAGGITLQLPGYAHSYDDAEQCATDIKDWLEDEDASGWDGNEEDAVIDPTQDQIANGGYRVVYLADLEGDDCSWGNAIDLRAALSINDNDEADVGDIDMEQWGASRETSTAVAMAIRDISDSASEMQSIWEDPTESQKAAVIASARRYAPDHAQLFWGEDGAVD